MKLFTSVVSIAALTAIAGAQVTLHDEGVDGDITNDRFAPLDLGVLDDGTFRVTASAANANDPSGDRDYFSITIAAGSSLDAIILDDLVSAGAGFVAVQAGSTFTVDPDAPNPATLLGYHIYPSSDVGTDILDDIGMGAGSIGFTGSLGPGTYTFWYQETSQTPTTSTFDFVVTPAPAGALAVGLFGFGLARRRR